jgi:putative heme-binding domain-containing protein
VERGRKIFFAPDKPGFVKCHRIGEQGGRVGPDLSGAGRRFPKVYLIESVLEPSRSIATAYTNWAVRLKDGRILNGVKVSETEAMLTLGDVEGKPQQIRKSEIEELKALALSLMPEGLEKGMTDKEFVDLIAFLLSQK